MYQCLEPWNEQNNEKKFPCVSECPVNPCPLISPRTLQGKKGVAVERYVRMLQEQDSFVWGSEAWGDPVGKRGTCAG